MPALPLLRPREVVRAFEQSGWLVARQRGSHIVLTKPGVPVTLSEFPITRRSLVARSER